MIHVPRPRVSTKIDSQMAPLHNRHTWVCSLIFERRSSVSEDRQVNEAAQRRLQRRLQLCSQVEDCFVTNELTKLGSQSDNFSRRLTGGKQHMACTIKRDALIQQHAALRCNPSFAPRPRKPRQHLLVYAALSVDSPSLSGDSCPWLPTPGLVSELPQEYSQIMSRPFDRLARLPSAP